MSHNTHFSEDGLDQHKRKRTTADTILEKRTKPNPNFYLTLSYYLLLTRLRLKSYFTN